jgi:hypothetical protein
VLCGRRGLAGYLVDDLTNYPDALQYGLILQVDDKSNLVGAGIVDEDIVQYPVAVVVSTTEDYI